MVDRLDYQRASHDVYNRKAVGLLAMQAGGSSPAAQDKSEKGSRDATQGGDGDNKPEGRDIRSRKN